MVAFEVLEKVFGTVGEVAHRIEQLGGGQDRLTVWATLDDDQIDQILVGHAQQVGMIYHNPATTTFVLV